MYQAPALEFLSTISTESIDMIYTDPPFGTGDVQRLDRKKKGTILSTASYSDRFDDYLEFLRPHVEEFYRVLSGHGTMYLHLDQRWSHYAKVMCDDVFGYDNFINEVIWSYNYGGRGKRCWPKKHDNILVYVKDRSNYRFNWDEIDKIPYAAPELQKDPVRAALGQVPTDVWPLGIIGTASKERVGYPNQKPVRLISRAIVASSMKGDIILDPFAGSGSTGAAALSVDRKFLMCDQSSIAIEVMKERFKADDVEIIVDAV